MNNGLDVFRSVYSRLWHNGAICRPRGMIIKEIENFSCLIPPYVRFTSFVDRNFKLSYVKREFLWYLNGDPKDVSICEYAKMWEKLINKDGIINSNYGQYIFGDEHQFFNAYYELRLDRDTRRASIVILQPKHLFEPDVKDLPCTYGIGFRIRNNKLNMTVKMRSQDAIFGFSNDIPAFSFIHEMMYVLLREVYTDLGLGDYFHFVDSFHVYGRHFGMIEKLASSSRYFEISCPKIRDSEEVLFLVIDMATKIHEVPDHFLFSKWLVNI